MFQFLSFPHIGRFFRFILTFKRFRKSNVNFIMAYSKNKHRELLSVKKMLRVKVDKNDNFRVSDGGYLMLNPLIDSPSYQL